MTHGLDYMQLTTKSMLYFTEQKKSELVIIVLYCIDYSYVPHLPCAGETLRATRYQTGFGGKGANSIVAAGKITI